MNRVYYAVTATLPSEALAREYLAWLQDGHIDKIIDGGAHSAMIIRLQRHPDDGLPQEAVQVKVQYVFPTRKVFEKYEREHAGPLRAEGRARFGPARAVAMVRSVNEIV